jgi:hypothetical protein
MNNDKNSLLEQAHLYIMAATLVIALVGWSLYLSPAKPKAPHDWFGYVPMSIQPAQELEPSVPVTSQHAEPARPAA